MKSKYQTFVTVQIKKAKIEATLEIILENLGQNLKCHIKNKNKTPKNTPQASLADTFKLTCSKASLLKLWEFKKIPLPLVSFITYTAKIAYKQFIQLQARFCLFCFHLRS